MNGEPVVFHEVQRFRQPWLWGILIALTLWVAGFFGYGLYRQLVLDRPWGERPMTDANLLLTASVVVLFDLGCLWFFRRTRMETVVREDGIHVRFVPFVRKTFHFDEIRECRARDYQPLREYGGWGIRFGPSGRAYSIGGSRGAQLELEGGRRVLIGSRRADELADAVAGRIGRGDA